MANFQFNGMDDIIDRLEQLANLTDEDRMAVIMPAAQLLVERQREKIKQLFHQRTGDLADSITIQQKNDADGAYAHIYLKGKHRGSSTGKRKGKRRSNGKYSGSNAEIGYILEYGSPRISASHWMEIANEEAEEAIASVEQDAWDALMQQKGL